MSLRLTGTYRSKSKILYHARIYDQELVTPSTDEMYVSQRPSWTWGGETKNIYQKLLPMSCIVGINVPGTTGPVADFVADLIEESDEHRFFLELHRDNQLFFRGWLQIDQSTIPIRSQVHYPFSLRATDTIGQFSNYDYINPATPEDPYRGTWSIKDHLIALIKSADIHEMYGDDDVLLVTSTDYHHAEMPNTTDDYMTRVLLDHRLFAAETEEVFKKILFFGTISLGEQPTEPGNVKEVIEQLCFTFNAVFFHAYGRYYFLSRGRLLDGNPIQVWQYKKSGALVNETILSEAITIGSVTVNNTGYYNHDGVYSFLTPIKELIIDHQKGGGNNKITGAEWVITQHGEQCFDEINNSGNASILSRFVLRVKIKHVNNTDTGYFRVVMGLKIKIGNYYLLRDIDGVDIYGNGNTVPLPTRDIPYTDSVWSMTEGYYYVVVDRRARASIFSNQDDDVTIVDIESPAIPEPGTLCVDVEMISLRKFDSFVAIFDDRWDTVTFTTEELFERSGKVFQLYWEAKDNYINIQSDDAELNEDTLSYTRYTAEVNLRNSERLEYSTNIGDDAGSNTHGRLQIDRSVAADGSDIVDADGGWTYRGAGTVYDNLNKLLAWDMARLRVGTVRVMTATNRGAVKTYLPMTLVSFDGKIQLMGSANVNSENEEASGVWLSLADVDNTKVTIKGKLFGKADASSPNTTNIYNGNNPSSSVDTRKYIHSATGITTDRIAIPGSKPLPEKEAHSIEVINSLFSQKLRDNGVMRYKATPDNDSSFGIDNTTNEIVLYRAPRSADIEYYFVWGE